MPQRRRLLPALAALAMAASLAACASPGRPAPVEQSITIAQPALRQFLAYPDIRVRENIVYRTVDDAPQKLNVCLPNTTDSTTPRAAIVVVHGGSWRTGTKDEISWRSVCAWLADAGYVAFSVDYRLAPAYPFPDGLSDVQAAVKWMREPSTVDKYDIDPDRIGAFGGSAGGNLVSMLGTSGYGDRTTGSRVAAVAELSAPADLTSAGPEEDSFIPLQLQYLHCTTLGLCGAAKKASPLYQVDVTDPPFFVAHSIDERIPLDQSEAFVAELRRHGVDTTFITVRGPLHSIAMLGTNLRGRILAFFDENLAA
ncbi:MAG: alpha/beta hydrolase [Microbacteriaceae bacterium]|nr:alpha/beta hydrolase [Microbacteriaceae bacterium]